MNDYQLFEQERAYRFWFWNIDGWEGVRHSLCYRSPSAPIRVQNLLAKA